MSADHVKIELARQVLHELSVPYGAVLSPQPMPTVASYLPRMVAAATQSQKDNYARYWQCALEMFGDRELDAILASDILALRRQVARVARPRRGRRNGRHAGEHCIRAMRTFFSLAVVDGFVRRENNPAQAVRLPRRLPSPRRALTGDEMHAINQVVMTTGRDVPLDRLLMRLHVETACRRGGALGLEVRDLCLERCAVLLREKFGTVRWQPVSPSLASALDTQARQRGAHDPTDQLLRCRDHRPLSRRHYDALWERIRDALPWAAQYEVATHWLRHTTITWVERNFGYAIARAYAGHTDAKGGSTLTYVKGLPQEVATALTVLTGEPHPLALPPAAARKIRR